MCLNILLFVIKRKKLKPQSRIKLKDSCPKEGKRESICWCASPNSHLVMVSREGSMFRRKGHQGFSPQYTLINSDSNSPGNKRPGCS